MLILCSGCTPEQAQAIIKLRPFSTVDDLNTKLGQGRKRAGPAGISPTMFINSTAIFEGYGTVDSVLEDCEKIGASLRHTIASWSNDAPVSATQANQMAPLPSENAEDGVLTLTTFAPLKDKKIKGYLDTQPTWSAGEVAGGAHGSYRDGANGIRFTISPSSQISTS